MLTFVVSCCDEDRHGCRFCVRISTVGSNAQLVMIMIVYSNTTMHFGIVTRSQENASRVLRATALHRRGRGVQGLAVARRPSHCIRRHDFLQCRACSHLHLHRIYKRIQNTPKQPVQLNSRGVHVHVSSSDIAQPNDQ